MFSSLRCSGALKQRNAEDKSAMPDQHQGKIIHLLLYVFVCTITAIYFPMPKILHLFDNSGKKDHSLLSEAHFGCFVSSKDSQSCKWRPFHNKVDNDMSCVYILKQRTNLSFTSIYIYLHLDLIIYIYIIILSTSTRSFSHLIFDFAETSPRKVPSLRSGPYRSWGTGCRAGMTIKQCPGAKIRWFPWSCGYPPARFHGKSHL